MNEKKEIKNHIIKIGIFVLALVTIGISLTYAYYVANLSGETSIDETNAAIFEVTSSLADTTSITNTKMSLINAEDVKESADKVEFSVTNSINSTVNGQYYIYSIDVHLTKNLYNKYFKWELVRVTQSGENVIDSGNFGTAMRSDPPTPNEADNVLTTTTNIPLNKIALEIPKGKTDNLIFRLWLENDSTVNQVDLTNGTFQGKLKIEASPVK